MNINPTEAIPSNSPQSADAASTPRRRIIELDALRSMAAINLVLFHFTHVYAVKFGYTTPLGGEWPYGAYGVMMFLMLSGFVNSMSLLRRGQPGDFVAARLIRIVPLFLIVIVANVFICSLEPLNSQPVSVAQFLANLTLMPRVFGYECIDPVMWTLQVEMMFYLVLVALFCSGGLKRYWLGWGSLLAASAVICPSLDALKDGYSDHGLFTIATALRHLLVLDFVPMFMIGFLLYMIKTKVGSRWHNLAGIAAAVIVFHCIDHGKHNPVATVLIIGLVALAAWGRIPILRMKPFAYVATISYAVYLCHNNLGCGLIHTFDHAGVPPLVSLAIVIVFSFAVGILVTHRIEQPLTRRLRAWYESVRSAQTVSANIA
ncbi:acyltransferase family protein [Neorhodopirellula lusitana]|uniref:acyltransferase family protein n=1 Tax=Neorhodopirellula lusitana TaxID=445327 RepID=UPI00384FBAFD